ncbi:MAG: cation-transporting P-type ATPase, partial [Bradyrhizobium guangdongense]
MNVSARWQPAGEKRAPATRAAPRVLPATPPAIRAASYTRSNHLAKSRGWSLVAGAQDIPLQRIALSQGTMTISPALFSTATGLTEQEAQARLKADGYNELPRQERRTPLRIILEVLREPMLVLLLGAGLVYLLLGDLREALILIAFGTISIIITVIQETRTERVLEALRDLTSPRALVIRDGER